MELLFFEDRDDIASQIAKPGCFREVNQGDFG